VKRLLCLLRGHAPIRVAPVDLLARPGGMLPALDGYVVYKPDPDGPRRACQRCHLVLGDADA
jgi:hypothetical protein